MDALTSTEGIAALAAGGVASSRSCSRSCWRSRCAGCAPPSGRCSARPSSATWSSTPRGSSRASWSCATGSRRPPPASTPRMAAAEARIDGCVAYRSLVRYDAYGEMSGPPVQLHRTARRPPLRRRDVLDPAPRERPRLREADRGGGVGAGAVPEEQQAVESALRSGQAAPTATEHAVALSVAFLGPAGTYTEEALLASAPGGGRARAAVHRLRDRDGRPGGRDRPRGRADRELARGRRGRHARRARGRGRRTCGSWPRWSTPSTTT